MHLLSGGERSERSERSEPQGSYRERSERSEREQSERGGRSEPFGERSERSEPFGERSVAQESYSEQSGLRDSWGERSGRSSWRLSGPLSERVGPLESKGGDFWAEHPESPPSQHARESSTGSWSAYVRRVGAGSSVGHGR